MKFYLNKVLFACYASAEASAEAKHRVAEYFASAESESYRFVPALTFMRMFFHFYFYINAFVFEEYYIIKLLLHFATRIKNRKV